MSQNNQYNTIEEALRDLREGKVILVTDDPDRENEGDLVCAAEFATQENINFMATYAKGLICTPMSAEIAARLNFPPMVAENTDNHSNKLNDYCKRNVVLDFYASRYCTSKRRNLAARNEIRP